MGSQKARRSHRVVAWSERDDSSEAVYMNTVCTNDSRHGESEVKVTHAARIGDLVVISAVNGEERISIECSPKVAGMLVTALQEVVEP